MTISSNVYKDEDDIMAQLIVYHRHASIIIGIKTRAGIRIYKYIYIYIYTWNLNDPCFDWKRPCFGGLKPQNRGQTGSRYIAKILPASYTPVYIHMYLRCCYMYLRCCYTMICIYIYIYIFMEPNIYHKMSFEKHMFFSKSWSSKSSFIDMQYIYI